MNIEALVDVAKRLQMLDIRFAFLGGAIVPLLLDETSITVVRRTRDVDVIVEVLTRLAYTKLEARLRDHGFKHDMSQGAPKCRWIVDDILLDVMAASDAASDWPSRWFPEALANSVPVQLSKDCTTNVVTAPFFIATKLAAFSDRGHHDFYGSHDLEDILTVLDGRAAILAEIESAPSALREHLAEQFANLLTEPEFTHSLAGHLPPDPASQERVPLLLKTIEQIALTQ